MDKGHRKLRDASLERYYADPAICEGCGGVIKVKPGRKPCEVRKQKYCSRSCSIRVSNTGRRRGNTTTICPGCGGKKDRAAKTCARCWRLKRFRDMERKPIHELFNRGNSRIKYAHIRKLAARAMELWEVPKTCSQCEGHEFDAVVEVHHVKRVSSFSDDALLGEVNAKENMVYLCPSHHALEDLKG